MRKITMYLRVFLILTISSLYPTVNAQESIDLQFDTKDYNGSVRPLTDRMDADKNYLILFSAFWCQPCVKQLDDLFSKNISVYRDLYNLEIIILNDDYYNETNVALNKIREKQWYFDQYFTDKMYGELGINAIPRDYLVIAGHTTGKRVHATNFLSKLEDYYVQNGYTSHFFNENRQVSINENCESPKVYEYSIDNADTINEKQYFQIENQYYRSGILNENIYRYDALIDDEVLVFDFYLDVCSSFILRDHQGDMLEVMIESREEINGEIQLVTDHQISNSCDDEIPLILSSQYGSNAGLVFDIENGEIVSQLVCHTQNGASIYEREDLTELCETVKTTDQNEVEIHVTNNPGNGIVEMSTIGQGEIQIKDINGYSVPFTMTENGVNFEYAHAGLYIISQNTDDGRTISLKYVKL